VVSFLRANLVWMLLSVVLSTALWVFVTFKEDPEVSHTLDNIPIEVQDKPKTMDVQIEANNARIVVSAPDSVWSQLKPDKFRAVVDASKVSPGLQEVPVKVISSDPRVRIESWQPSQVFLKVEPLRSTKVAVQVVLSGSVPFYYESGAPRVTPSEITVTGPESVVDKVTGAVVTISLDGATKSIGQTFRPVIQGVPATDAERLTLNPDGVFVEVPIDQKLAYKTLPVQPQIVGHVALGYQIIDIRPDPQTVTLVGNPQALEQMSVVPTKPIDVSGADGDRAYDATLDLPPSVAMEPVQKIIVRVLVTTVNGTKTFLISPQVINLGQNQTYTVSPGAVNVTLAGPIPILNRIQPADIRVTVDASSLASGGQASLNVQVKSPDLTTVQDVQPAKVSVTVSAVR